MPTYVFFLINHLGEPFEASELDFEDDRQADAYAASLLARAIPWRFDQMASASSCCL